MLAGGEVGTLDSLGEDQEHADAKEKENVEAHKGPEEKEIGEHSCAKTTAEPLQRPLPQLQRTEEGEAAVRAMATSLWVITRGHT